MGGYGSCEVGFLDGMPAIRAKTCELGEWNRESQEGLGMEASGRNGPHIWLSVKAKKTDLSRKIS